MTSLHVICGLGPSQSKILATPMFRRLSVFIPFFKLSISCLHGVAIIETGCHLALESKLVEEFSKITSEVVLTSQTRLLFLLQINSRLQDFLVLSGAIIALKIC